MKVFHFLKITLLFFKVINTNYKVYKFCREIIKIKDLRKKTSKHHFPEITFIDTKQVHISFIHLKMNDSHFYNNGIILHVF